MGRGVIEPERPVKVTDLLIRQKAEAMILWAYSALRQFPRHERHVLAAEMRRTLWSLLRLIVVCNKKYFKKTTLQELDAEIDLLRSQVRLADYYRQGLVSLTRVQQGVTSWIAHAQHAQTWGLRRTLLGELAFTREARHVV